MPATEFAITPESGWHRYEDKLLELTTAIDLDGKTLRWLLLSETGGTVLLTKTGAKITVVNDDDDNIAKVEIDTPTDYTALEAGWYYYELWNDSDHNLLLYGDAFLGEGAALV